MQMHLMESGVWLQVRRLVEDPLSILERNLYSQCDEVPLDNRSTVRLLQGAVGLPKTMIHHIINQEKLLQMHTKTIKPLLMDVNKMARLDFCLNELGKNGLYNAMFDRVHVDEKWFFLTSLTE
jgi:hypothetical protein